MSFMPPRYSSADMARLTVGMPSGGISRRSRASPAVTPTTRSTASRSTPGYSHSLIAPLMVLVHVSEDGCSTRSRFTTSTCTWLAVCAYPKPVPAASVAHAAASASVVITASSRYCSMYHTNEKSVGATASAASASGSGMRSTSPRTSATTGGTARESRKHAYTLQSTSGRCGSSVRRSSRSTCHLRDRGEYIRAATHKPCQRRVHVTAVVIVPLHRAAWNTRRSAKERDSCSPNSGAGARAAQDCTAASNCAWNAANTSARVASDASNAGRTSPASAEVTRFITAALATAGDRPGSSTNNWSFKLGNDSARSPATCGVLSEVLMARNTEYSCSVAGTPSLPVGTRVGAHGFFTVGGAAFMCSMTSGPDSSPVASFARTRLNGHGFQSAPAAAGAGDGAVAASLANLHSSASAKSRSPKDTMTSTSLGCHWIMKQEAAA